VFRFLRWRPRALGLSFAFKIIRLLCARRSNTTFYYKQSNGSQTVSSLPAPLALQTNLGQDSVLSVSKCTCTHWTRLLERRTSLHLHVVKRTQKNRAHPCTESDSKLRSQLSRPCSASAVKLYDCGIGSNCRGGLATAAKWNCSRTSSVGF